MEKENEAKKSETKHSYNKNKLGVLTKTIIGVIIFVIVIVIFAIIWYNICLSGTGTANDKISLDIPMGSGTSKIAKVLKENDVIRSEMVFKLYVKINKINSFQAGSYDFTKNMTVPEIAEALQSGKILRKDGVNITFVEGKTFRYIASEIAKNTNNTEEDVYNTLKNEEYINSLIDEYWFLTDEIKNADIYYALEGYLFPDTYSFKDKDVKVEEIFKAMLKQMEKVLDEYKQDIEKSGYNIHDILTVASIAENEAIFDKDRKDVTSVIYNRIDKKISIGSDVTTYYAFKIDLGSRDLYKTEINTYNPYNTRGPGMAGKLPIRTNMLS